MADDATSRALLIACPHDGALNRLPVGKLGDQPRCGKCHQPLFEGRPLELTSVNFENQVMKSDLPALIDFWAAWCGPCKAMAPNFAQASARLEPRMRLAKLDTEAEPQIAAHYNIGSIPTLLLVRRGRELARTAGVMPTSAIVQWAQAALAQA